MAADARVGEQFQLPSLTLSLALLEGELQCTHTRYIEWRRTDKDCRLESRREQLKRRRWTTRWWRLRRRRKRIDDDEEGSDGGYVNIYVYVCYISCYKEDIRVERKRNNNLQCC